MVEYKGADRTTVRIDGDNLVIERSGAFNRMNKTAGTRRIPLSALTEVHYQASHGLTPGHVLLKVGEVSPSNPDGFPEEVRFYLDRTADFRQLHDWLSQVVARNRGADMPAAALTPPTVLPTKKESREQATRKARAQAAQLTSPGAAGTAVSGLPPLRLIELAEMLKETTSRMNFLDHSIKEAVAPHKLAKVGVGTRVELFDTEVRLPGGRVVPLSGLVAEVTHHGQVQVVRQPGLISNTKEHDRRETMLRLTWPGGEEVVRWERSGSFVKPEEVHRLAGQINAAAPNAATARARRERRQLSLRSARLSELTERAQTLETALTTLKSGIPAYRSAAAEKDGKPARKLLSQALDVEASAEKVLQEIKALCERETRRLAEESASSALAQASPPQPVEQHAPPADVAQPDVVGLLKQLAELRDSGVLTEAEFDAKKAELLKRL